MIGYINKAQRKSSARVKENIKLKKEEIPVL
jgi:hypothetical protein